MKSKAEKINDYIDNCLEPQELLAFEEEMKADSTLREEIELYRDVQGTLSKRMSRQEQELRQSLIHAQHKSRTTTGKALPFKKMLTFAIPIVAAACIIVVVRLFFFNAPDDLYNLPTMHTAVVRGATDGESSYAKAATLFNAEDYSAAMPLLQDLVSDEPTNLQYKYYLGLCHYGMAEYTLAAQILQPLAAGTSVFKNESRYYLALAYHKGGKDQEAIHALKQVEDTSTMFKKASRLLQKLEQKK